MTFIEFMKKLNTIIEDNNKIKKDISQNEIYFFAEDEYQTFDVKIDNIEIEDNKIFLS
tara:strand:- start:977 stop:1150 length:174 start_codon:yes stop_codon:yes gene_type:complete